MGNIRYEFEWSRNCSNWIIEYTLHREMSGTNGYGAKDAGLRSQKLRGQIRWRSKQLGIETTRGGPSGSFSADASNMPNTAFISDSAIQCVACSADTLLLGPH
jgi:hypothetical protein